LELSTYLINEEDLIPWQAALKAFSYIGSMIGEDDEESFHEFMFKLMTPLYKKLGFEEGEKDDHLTVVLRRFVKGFNDIYT
jgi:hypothetical protein